jgi:hypothetical protein
MAGSRVCLKRPAYPLSNISELNQQRTFMARFYVCTQGSAIRYGIEHVPYMQGIELFRRIS